MDIEWGRDGVDGKIYILQARPETGKSQQSKQDVQQRSSKQLVMYLLQIVPSVKRLVLVRYVLLAIFLKWVRFKRVRISYGYD